MTEQQFLTQLEALLLDTQTYADSIPIAYKNYALPIITTDNEQVYKFIVDQNWQDLKSFSEAKLLNLESKMLDMATHQYQINSLTERLFNLKDAFKKHYREPQTKDDWVAKKNALITSLNNNNTPQDKIDEFIKKVGGTGGLNAYKYQLKQYDILAKYLNYAFERHLAHSMYHYSAIVFSDYNINIQVNQNITFNTSTKIRSLSNSIKRRNSTLLNNIKDNNQIRLKSNSNNLNHWTGNTINQFGLPILIHCFQERILQNSSFLSDGKKALKASSLIQNLLFNKASSKWINWTSGFHKELNLSENLFDKKENLINEDITLTENLISIKKILKNPNQYNNQEIVIRGVVTNLEVKHIGPTKVISTADISDSKGRILKVCLPHIKLDSGGLVNNSFVYISGRFLVNNPEANNAQALSIDRLSIGELSKTNWIAWARYELRNIFEPIPHNLNLKFTLESGNNGALNPIKYNVTFSKNNLLNFKNI
ncbi:MULTISPECIES: hypothetical protein [Flavobacterium]|uniref:Uncharacterized protein n=1 Tax=Flavobacterium jumunjinense TaxID=998845 RepID=A0ABV5GL46_9FLAO|nr:MULTISPECIES: hypothetical protein [Flavobacterium]